MLITICGRLRYKELIGDLERVLTYCGNTVFLPPQSELKHEMTDREIEQLHRAHDEKIMRSDLVLVISPYGDDTMRERVFAEDAMKKVHIIHIHKVIDLINAYEKDGASGVRTYIKERTIWNYK